MKNITIENGQVEQMKEQFFRPLECSTAYGVTVGHSVTFIHIAHMTVIFHHNFWLCGFSFIAEITFLWGIVNIRQHVYVSLVPPHYCRQVSPGSNTNVSPFQSQSLNIFKPKRLCFFGKYCLKITLPLKGTITSSIATFSEGLYNLENVSFRISNRSRIFHSLSKFSPVLSGTFLLSVKCT
jgi:hypothetical protein